MKRPGIFACYLAVCTAALVALAAMGGCRSTSRRDEGDAEVRRHAEAARLAFAEGADTEAIDRYRLAVRRAWLLDDPVQIGTNAYNLAATLAAVSRYAEARDWLREARAELVRAGRDPANVQILEAKIARQQGAFFEAVAISDSVHRAVHVPGGERPNSSLRAAAHKPHQIGAASYVHGQGGLIPLSDLPKRLSDRRRRKRRSSKHQDRAAAEVQLHLLWASLAMDQADLDRAAEEIETARRYMARVRDLAVHAELERVAARLLLFEGRPLDAAARFDAEAELLRHGESYREIPAAYEAAGGAYESAGVFDLAAERYVRVARILYALDELTAALLFIDRAFPLAEVTGDVDLLGRVSIVFNEAARAVEEGRKTKRNGGDSGSSNEKSDDGASPRETIEPIPHGAVDRSSMLPSP